MDASHWKLTHLGTAEERTMAAWGIDAAGLQRQLVNQAIDQLTFTQRREIDDALEFAVGDLVRVTRGGTGFFHGRVSQRRVVGQPGEEFVQYLVTGPWWWLENLPAQQGWKLPTTPTNPASPLVSTLKSRIILGADEDGDPQATGGQIREFIQLAIDAGAPIQIGDILTGIEIPTSEQVDITCAEVIRILLRWTPDAVVQWDYSTNPPTIHVRQRAAVTTHTRAVGTQPLQGLEFTSREDLQVPGVVLKFEQTHQLDNKTWSTLTVQQAGLNTFGSLVLTLEMAGSSASYQRQALTTALIEPSSITWWLSKLKHLAGATGPDGTGSPVVEFGNISSASFIREVIFGAIPPWLSSHAMMVTVTAAVSYKLVNSNGAEVVKTREPVAVRVMGSTLGSGTYERQVSYTAAEAIPSGLAQAIYDALQPLQWEGMVTLEEDEISGAFMAGDLLNLTGGRTEWATMAAQIQQIVEDVGAGRTLLRCGPPNQLGPQDYVALQRMNRYRRSSSRIEERADGVSRGVAGASEGPAASAVENSSTGAVGETRLVFSAGGSTGTIVLDIADIPPAYGVAELKLREVDICFDGVAAKMMVLGSLPRTIE